MISISQSCCEGCRNNESEVPSRVTYACEMISKCQVPCLLPYLHGFKAVVHYDYSTAILAGNLCSTFDFKTMCSAGIRMYMWKQDATICRKGGPCLFQQCLV